MRLKIDENIGHRGVALLRAHGHDVETVEDEGLRGVSDEDLFSACSSENRILITLDRGFGQVLRFRPSKNSGIVILESGPRFSLESLLARLREFLSASSLNSVEGAVWVVEPGRIRIHLDK